MSARAISEASGKRILNSTLEANCGAAVCRYECVNNGCQISQGDNLKCNQKNLQVIPEKNVP